jgi:hypothetical protein
MFKHSNVANMKRALEGRGFVTRSMFATPIIEFEGASVFITSNGLPALSTDEDHVYDWDAIRARTAFIHKRESYPDRGRQAFPFTTAQLAHYLLHMHMKYEGTRVPTAIA